MELETRYSWYDRAEKTNGGWYPAHTSKIIGDDATKHMKHYFKNTDKDYVIDLQGMIDESPGASQLFDNEVIEAQRFVESLPAGTHHITTDTPVTGYNYRTDSWNWFYAVGGYAAWITGVAGVKEVFNDKDHSYYLKYRLDFDYKVEDRYNWDQDKTIPLPFTNSEALAIPDNFLGEFHLQGLAREFTMKGSISVAIEWDSNNPYDYKVVSPSK